MTLNESTVEYAPLEWFEQLDDAVGHGLDFAPRELVAEPDCNTKVVLLQRMDFDAMDRNEATPRTCHFPDDGVKYCTL